MNVVKEVTVTEDYLGLDEDTSVLTKSEQQLDRFLNLHWKDKLRGFSTIDSNLFPFLMFNSIPSVLCVKKSINTMVNITFI